jgi:glucosamine-6-phosphate deaminase
MKIIIADNKRDLGNMAAAQGATLINQAIQDNGYATIVVPTGASQFEMLSGLTGEKIDWSKVTAFHLDEYIGIPITHPASFRKYLKERFVDKVPVHEFHFVNGEIDTGQECSRLGELISRSPVDVAFIGIGENGHIAFNDPPADFDTEAAYIKVELDEACRRQQTNEGWFSTIEDVPATAISMSVKQILRSRHIICSVPDERKALAVKNAIEGEVSARCPASILQRHNAVWLYLDKDSSSLLTG